MYPSRIFRIICDVCRVFIRVQKYNEKKITIILVFTMKQNIMKLCMQITAEKNLKI